MIGDCCGSCRLVKNTVRQIRNIQGNDDVGLVDLELQDGAPTENSQLTADAPRDQLNNCVAWSFGGASAGITVASISLGMLAGFKGGPTQDVALAVFRGFLVGFFSEGVLLSVAYLVLLIGLRAYTCYHSCQNAAS